MRLLNSQEILSISGAAYHDDIKTIVYTLKAGSYIGDLGYAAGEKAAAALSARLPATAGSIASCVLPVLGQFAIPVAILTYVLIRHPEMRQSLWDKISAYI